MDWQTFINLTDTMPSMSGSAFKILTLIAQHDEQPPLSYSMIRAKTNIASDATVRNCLKQLIGLGLVKMQPYHKVLKLPPSSNTSACSICGEFPQGRSSLDKHHIHLASKGGNNEPENITYLCHDCHIAVHSNCYRFIQQRGANT